ALFYVHTCKDKDCKLLPDNTEHIFKNISTHYFDKSFETFPAPPKDNSTSKTTPFTPDYIIFKPNQQYIATFNKTIPLYTLNELAIKADQKFDEINNSETNSKQTAFYFYSYLKVYLNTTTKNDSISDLELNKALEKIITSTINPHILAHIILYFHIQS
ncbi:24795_t:CDS:1, partial [Cetraspora pellucida]